MVGGTGGKKENGVKNFEENPLISSPKTLRVMDCWLLPATLVPTHTHAPTSPLLTEDIINDPVPSPPVADS